MFIEPTLSGIKLYVPLFLAIAVSILLGVASHFFLYQFILKRYQKPQNPLYAFLKQIRGLLWVVFPLIYVNIANSLLDFKEATDLISLITKLFFILTITWSILKLVDYSELLVNQKYRNQGKSFYRPEILTRVHLLKKIIRILIVIIAISLLLLSFDSVKEIGKGIIFSAGAIGAVAVLAAQKLFSNIISGFQLAFTKPIQIGDFIRVADEAGSIEEITLTYVVVRTWDLRKLVIPLAHLMEKPFENWTQLIDNNLIGIIFFYTDYSINIEQIRKYFTQIVTSSPLWNKKMAKLEVTDLKERSMELRALVSACNVGDVWNLRCYVREKLIEYIVHHFPHSLSQTRLSGELHIDTEKYHLVQNPSSGGNKPGSSHSPQHHH